MEPSNGLLARLSGLLADNGVGVARLTPRPQGGRLSGEPQQEVEDALKQEIGQDRVLARTRRHLYQRVMAMRVLEFDHFENEEAFVVSLVGERISEQQQLEMARHLLFDDEAEDPRWIIDWVAAELTPAGRSLLSELESRLPEAHGREAPGEDGASRSWLARLGAALFGKGR